VRPLTLEMIRRLATALDLPADVLIRGYKRKRVARVLVGSKKPGQARFPDLAALRL